MPLTATGPHGQVTYAISVGVFLNRAWPSDSDYVDMANNLLKGLQAGQSEVPGNPPFRLTIWFDAHPWEVNSMFSRFTMNAVNVAYTEPHGNWLKNTTLSNYGDFWYVEKINPGFGAATGGVLATWVIMSCEVVPSYYDRANEQGGSGNGFTAFDAWWGVFQGLHNVLGFRTEMFFPDAEYQFGFDAALGGDVNAVWFSELAANYGNLCCYNDGHLIGNPSVHFDRGSTFVDARDIGQSIYNVGQQTPSTTLCNFWVGN
jgi:hypothetical protein